MLEQYIYINKYKWEVYSFYNVQYKDKSRIEYKLKRLDFNEKIINEITNNLSTINNGFCYSDFKTQRSVIVINKTSSKGEFINSFIHELNHLGSHIEEKYNIDPYSEEASYLIGDVSQQIYYKYLRTQLND